MLLVEAKAEIQAKDNAGRTALHLAAWQGHEATAWMLLVEGKAQIETKDNRGRTALDLATAYGRKTTAWMLSVEGTAEAEAKDNGGRTALCPAPWVDISEGDDQDLQKQKLELRFTTDHDVRLPSSTDRIKIWAEGLLNGPVNWWPLSDVWHFCAAGKTRVHWDCVGCTNF